MKQNEIINGIKVINTLNSDVSRKVDSEQVPILNIFKRDKIRINRKSFQNLVSKKNMNILKSKKNLMTKEQRTILKSFLKENAKQNKKTVAKNLIGFFLESSKNSQNFLFKNKLVENNIKKIDSSKGIIHTPRNKLHLINKKKNANSLNKDKIKKKSTVEIRPSMFNKFVKNKNNSNRNFQQPQKSEKDLSIKLVNSLDSKDDDH